MGRVCGIILVFRFVVSFALNSSSVSSLLVGTALPLSFSNFFLVSTYLRSLQTEVIVFPLFYCAERIRLCGCLGFFNLNETSDFDFVIFAVFLYVGRFKLLFFDCWITLITVAILQPI